MIWIDYLVLVYFALLIFVFLFLIVFLLFDKPEKISIPADFPFVSVFVAVRNEEENIEACLKSLSLLNWPEDKLEILIGNDSSEDLTEEIVMRFIADKPLFRLISVKEKLGRARGKANVLAHLAREAKGEFFCITDADIRVTENWLQGLVFSTDKTTGTVSGSTVVKVNNLFSAYQTIDWVNSLAMIRVMNNLKVPVTAVGNNMMVTREAYFSTGGYENIPFSITEDFELFRQTLHKGWKFKNLLQPEVIVYTEPVRDIQTFLRQRKRWMKGAMQLPLLMIFLLSIQAASLPFIVYALLFLPYGIVLWLLKVFFSITFNYLTLKKLGKTELLKHNLIYELSAPVFNMLQLVWYWLPGKVVWKGRKY